MKNYTNLTRLVIIACALVSADALTVNADYVSVVTADAPLAWYRMNETSGATAGNSGSASGIDATNAGGVTLGIAGIPGGGVGNYAYGYDGINGQTSTPGNAVFRPGNLADGAGWTVEAWAKMTDPDSTYNNPLLSWYNGADSTYMLLVTSGQPSGWGRDQDGDSAYMTATSVDIRNSQWHHLVLTLDSDGITSNQKLYIDGQLEVAMTQPVGVLSGPDTKFLAIGWVYSPNPGDVAYFPGALDEVAIYNKALLADDVLAHYVAGIASVPEPSLLSMVVASMTGLLAYGRRRRTGGSN